MDAALQKKKKKKKTKDVTASEHSSCKCYKSMSFAYS